MGHDQKTGRAAAQIGRGDLSGVPEQSRGPRAGGMHIHAP